MRARQPPTTRQRVKRALRSVALGSRCSWALPSSQRSWRRCSSSFPCRRRERAGPSLTHRPRRSSLTHKGQVLSYQSHEGIRQLVEMSSPQLPDSRRTSRSPRTTATRSGGSTNLTGDGLGTAEPRGRASGLRVLGRYRQRWRRGDLARAVRRRPDPSRSRRAAPRWALLRYTYKIQHGFLGAASSATVRADRRLSTALGRLSPEGHDGR